jgi:hypothetical protein
LKTTQSIPLTLTNHASHRLNERAISKEAIQFVVEYGREVHCKGAVIYVFGNKEVNHYRKKGLHQDWDQLSGLQVITSSDYQEQIIVITVYRNHDFSQLRKINFLHSKKYLSTF